jgi:hypothetical protein
MKMTEKDITGQWCKDLRRRLAMTQRQFWGPLGITQAPASSYETGKRDIPRPVRMLILANHVAGGKVEQAADYKPGANWRKKKQELQARERAIKSAATRAVRALDAASAEVARARGLIDGIV